MNVRAILVVVHASDYRQETDTVRKAFPLRNKVDNILSEAVHARCQDKLSLSKMTFSHQMVRAIFAEQLYRAFTILKGEPYHHE